MLEQSALIPVGGGCGPVGADGQVGVRVNLGTAGVAPSHLFMYLSHNEVLDGSKWVRLV